MERECKTWPEIEAMVIEHIRQSPLKDKVSCFEFVYDNSSESPSYFELETVITTAEEHGIYAEYISRFIDILDEIYQIVPLNLN